MKRSLIVLAILALSSSAFAADTYNREKVLDLFAQYNPSVLQRASEDATYNSILQELAENYDAPENMQSRLELIALIRNFDNSLALSVLDQGYGETFLLGKVSGEDISSARENYRSHIRLIMSKIWAVSVQTQELRLQEYKDQLKQAKQDTALSAEEKNKLISFLNEQIKNTRFEIKNLKKNAPEQIIRVTDDYIKQRENDWSAELFAAREQLAQQDLQAAQADNLQISYKNKKPVAK